jgi:hypothetical protein
MTDRELLDLAAKAAGDEDSFPYDATHWMQLPEPPSKDCTYPDCKCPFDMGHDNKCLIGRNHDTP